MKVLVLGDLHGPMAWIANAIYEARQLFRIEAAIQVGDVGLCADLFDEELWWPAFAVPVHMIPGNHDDHRFLFHAHRRGQIGVWQQGNLHVYHRPGVADIGGRRVLFCGGALHAHRPQEWAGRPAIDVMTGNPRTPPRNPAWCNFVSDGMVTEAARLGPADLVVTHSCPHSIGVGMVGDHDLLLSVAKYCDAIGIPSGPFDDCGEHGLTRLWHHGLRPANWVFGHFHRLRQATVERTVFTCVGSTGPSDGVRGVRPVIWDTVTNIVEVYPDVCLGIGD